MKANLSVKVSFFVGVFAVIALFFSAPNLLAGSELAEVGSVELDQISEKLDASQKRKEQMLTNQEKILSEIEKSRKIAFNNRGRSAGA